MTYNRTKKILPYFLKYFFNPLIIVYIELSPNLYATDIFRSFRIIFADIVVFNPDTIIDQATWDNPHQYPRGIEHVMVNGTLVITEGEHTGALPGKILKKA